MAKKLVSSLSELHNKAIFDHVAIIVEHEEDEPLNCGLVDGNTGIIMVMNVSENSLLYEKLQIGDYFLTINDRTFKNREEMFRIANRAYPEMKLIVARAKAQSSTTTQSKAQQQQQSTLPSLISQTTLSPTAGETPSSAQSTKQPTKPLSAKKVRDQSEDQSAKREAPPERNSSLTVQSDPKSIAKSKGFIVKPDRQYFVRRVLTSKSGKSLGLGIMRVSKENAVIVSSVQPNSVSSDIFKPGDRFLMINKSNITDVQVCRKLILETKGDFDALIERPPNGMHAYGLESQKSTQPVVPLSSSYSPPVKNNPEHFLGNPQVGYETAPADVQAILNRQIPELIKAFGFESQRSSQRQKSQKSDRLTIQNEVHEENIESDVAPGSMLRKPPKRG